MSDYLPGEDIKLLIEKIMEADDLSAENARAKLFCVIGAVILEDGGRNDFDKCIGLIKQLVAHKKKAIQ